METRHLGDAVSTRRVTQWQFLKPWRDVLRPVLEYVDGDELALGTMDNRLESLQLHMWGSLRRLAPVIKDDSEDKMFVWIREALELVGLALHYDKRAWKGFLHPVKWDRSRVSEPFLYGDVSNELDPVFQVTFHHEDCPEGWYSLDYLYSLFTKIAPQQLRKPYHEARKRVHSIVGSDWDSSYRIPLWLVPVPLWGPSNQLLWTDRVRKVMEQLGDPSSVSGSAFRLDSMSIMLWRAPLQSWIVDFVEEIRVANVVLKQFGLPLWESDRVAMGVAVNAATGYGHVYRARGRQMEHLSIDDTTVDGVVAVCSSVMQTRELERLDMYEAFPTGSSERAACWRWLGYALTNGADDCSLRELMIRDSSITEQDARNVSTSALDAASMGSLPLPPELLKSDLVRLVHLDIDASIFIDNVCGWQTLRNLRLSEQDSFSVQDEDATNAPGYDSTIQILVPGFGWCEAKCEDIVDATAIMPRTTPSSALERLELEFDTCESPALPLLVTSIGTNLRRLTIFVKNKLTLSSTQAQALLQGCPRLEFLELQSVSFGSMEVLTSAFEEGLCRVGVISLFDSYVDAWSMTDFFESLSDPTTRVWECIREFRYIYETRDPETGKCPAIIDEYGVLALDRALHSRTTLRMIDIGLTRPLYLRHHEKLQQHDKNHATDLWQRSKLAFLSVFIDHDHPSKRRRRSWRPICPTPYRQVVMSRILSFVTPQMDRVVSVIRVPRRVARWRNRRRAPETLSSSSTSSTADADDLLPRSDPSGLAL